MDRLPRRHPPPRRVRPAPALRLRGGRRRHALRGVDRDESRRGPLRERVPVRPRRGRLRNVLVRRRILPVRRPELLPERAERGRQGRVLRGRRSHGAVQVRRLGGRGGRLPLAGIRRVPVTLRPEGRVVDRGGVPVAHERRMRRRKSGFGGVPRGRAAVPGRRLRGRGELRRGVRRRGLPRVPQGIGESARGG